MIEHPLASVRVSVYVAGDRFARVSLVMLLLQRKEYPGVPPAGRATIVASLALKHEEFEGVNVRESGAG